MAKRVWVAFLLLIAAFRLSPAHAETWDVVCEDQFPPYNFIKDGKRTGLDTEIVRAVLAEIGVEENLQAYPWSRALGTLDSGAADLLYQVVDSPARREKYILVGPLRRGRTVLAVRAGQPFQPSGISELAGHDVGVVRGFKYTVEFDAAPLNKIAANDNQTLVRMLAAKRLDVIIGDRDALKFVANEDGLGDKIFFLPRPLGEIDRYVALPKDRADKAERFHQGLETIRANGTLEKILKRWE